MSSLLWLVIEQERWGTGCCHDVWVLRYVKTKYFSYLIVFTSFVLSGCIIPERIVEPVVIIAF